MSSNESGRPSTYDPEYHINKILELMSKGMTDVEVCADLDISVTTLWRWRKANPDLEEAYQKGLAKGETVSIIKPLRNMIETGNERGYKALAHLSRNKYGHDKQTLQSATQINIGSINLSSKEDYEKLASQIKDDLINLNIIDADFVQLDQLEDKSKDDSE